MPSPSMSPMASTYHDGAVIDTEVQRIGQGRILRVGDAVAVGVGRRDCSIQAAGCRWSDRKARGR